MNRATGTAAARAIDRLLLANKPPPEPCECDQSIELRRQLQDRGRRISGAQPWLESAIVKLAEIASSPTSAAGEALTDLRRALSALENES